MTRALTSADDTFHPRSNDPWWTETVWFAWMVPERNLLGYFYPLFRPNLGVYGGGVTVFDDTASMPWELPFHAWDWHQPLPPGLDLRDAELGNGMTLVAEQPHRVFRLGYQHRDGLQLDLRYEAETEPLVTEGTPPFNAGHIDQIGRVSGTMVLHGERIDVNCLAMRDRSWGPRAEGPQPRAGYAYAAVPGGDSFLAVSIHKGDTAGVGHGFLRRDGVQHRVVSGHRTVERNDAGRPTAITIDATDTEGRPFTARGTVVSQQALIAYSTMLCWNSLVRWELDGAVCWGEDQDTWHPRVWRREHVARRSTS